MLKQTHITPNPQGGGIPLILAIPALPNTLVARKMPYSGAVTIVIKSAVNSLCTALMDGSAIKIRTAMIPVRRGGSYVCTP